MASLALVFDLLARDKASAEFRKVGEAAQASGKQTESSIARIQSSVGKLAAAAGGIAGAVTAALAAINADQANDVLAAQLGLTAKESERAGKLAGSLFRDAYGENLGEVNAALRGVQTNIGDLGKFSDGAIKGMSANALDLAKVMGEDVDRVTRGVGQLIRNDLVRDADQGFDLITAAAQRLPASMQGELIDTIEEYSADLGSLGLTGEQAFGAISAAVQAGARNTDLAADAFREFSIRAIDGSKTTRQGFELLGLDADKMAQKIAAGGPTATRATSEIIRALAGMSDPIAQEAAGVALFGTRYEELGIKAISAMDPMAASLGDVSGAADKMGKTLNDNFGTRLETWKRTAAGFAQDGLMAIADGFTDGVSGAGGWRGVLQQAGAVARTVFEFLRNTAIPAIRDVAKWMSDNRGVVLSLAAAFGTLVAITKVHAAVMAVQAVGGLLAYLKGTKLVSAAIRTWTAVQWLLTAALTANPIGIVIAAVAALVAGVVIAYQKSQTFRKIVDNAFRVVAAAGKWMWENILKPAFNALMAAWRWVADGIRAAWNSIIKPAWDALRATFSFLWNSVLKPAFAALSAAWSATGTRVRAVWTGIIKPAWDAIRAAIGVLWNSVLKPIFAAIGSAFSAAGSAIRSVYNNVIKPVFTAFSQVGETVRRAFSTAVNGIVRIWQGLKSTLRAPIQAVIDVVWNNGLRKMWNVVNDLWGGSDLPTVSLARGGVMPGYTPGRDVHKFYSPTGGVLELSGGEAVMRPEFTRALGRTNIDALNSIARREGAAGMARALEHGLPHARYAHGGIFAGARASGSARISTSLPSWLSAVLSLIPGGSTISGLLQKVNGANLGGGLLGSGLGSMVGTILGRMWAKAKELWDGQQSRTGGGGSFGTPGGGGSLGSSYQSMFAAIKRAFPEARLNSGYRPGDPGYHGRGKAVDIGWSRAPGGIGNAFMASVNRWLYDRHRGSLAELIYNGLGDDRPNWWKGRNYAYSAGTQAQHRNHVHAAVYDQGGILPPGYTLAYNGTGRNEYVSKGMSVQHDTVVYAQADARQVAREIDRINQRREREAFSAR